MDVSVVSVIIPVHNAAAYLYDCLVSVADQVAIDDDGQRDWRLEVCVFDDASTDGSMQELERARPLLEARGVRLEVVNSISSSFASEQRLDSKAEEEEEEEEEDLVHGDVKAAAILSSEGTCSNQSDQPSQTQAAEESLSKCMRIAEEPASSFPIAATVNDVPSAAATGATVISSSPSDTVQTTLKPIGVGAARNRAVSRSTGNWLFFQDADDLMLPGRIAQQLQVLRACPTAIVGTNFVRLPEDATPRYTRYHQSLDNDAKLLAYAFRDCSLVMPTWALSRASYDAVGGFVEDRNNQPLPEDLHFFYRHWHRGGLLKKVYGPPLMVYRHHAAMTSLKLHRRDLLTVRTEWFERIVLDGQWAGRRFFIWGAGRDGKDFFKRLSAAAQARVITFADVAVGKINQPLYGRRVIPFQQIGKPFVTCVALDRNAEFEANLRTIAGEEELGDTYYPII